jgi:broad specificity phosphatase PhoE
MTMFYLVRHGSTDVIGKVLVGWMPEIHLNQDGRRQVAELPRRFEGVPLSAVYSSPLERTRETADGLAKHFSLDVEYSDDIGEVHYGGWTGRTITDLDRDPRWHEYNTSRSSFRIPGGETGLEVRTRVVRFLEHLARTFPGAHIAIVSHGDPIKTAVMHYLGMPLDMFYRFEISPSSVTIIRDHPERSFVIAVNTQDVILSQYLLYA